MNDEVTLKVNGEIYRGWKSVKIEISLEQIARAFALSVTDDFPGNINFKRLQTGDLVQLYIGSDLVCTGYITSVPVKYDAKKITVTVQGKSKTVDLVDCCPPAAAYASDTKSSGWSDVKGVGQQSTPKSTTPKTSWNNQPVRAILSDLCAPYGINVYGDVDPNLLKNHTVNPGEKVVDSINRLLLKQNLIVSDDEFGNLSVMNKKVIQSDDALLLSKNILSASANFDASQRYSHYVTLGQHKGSDDDFSQSSAGDNGQYIDAEVSRFRLLVLKDQGQSSNDLCKNHSENEGLLRRAKYLQFSYKVQGFRQSTGKLWQVGHRVWVEDEVAGIFENMLILGLSFELSASGSLTTLKVAPSEITGNNSQASKSGASDSWDSVS